MQVREQGQQKGEASPYLAELLRLEEQAKQEGLGRWSKVCLFFPLLIKSFFLLAKIVIKVCFLPQKLIIRCEFVAVLATWCTWKPKCIVFGIFADVKQVFTTAIVLKLYILHVNLLVLVVRSTCMIMF